MNPTIIYHLKGRNSIEIKKFKKLSISLKLIFLKRKANGPKGKIHGWLRQDPKPQRISIKLTRISKKIDKKAEKKL